MLVSRRVCPEVIRCCGWRDPNADLILPLLRCPRRAAQPRVARALRGLGTNLGCDAKFLMRVFDSLPEVTARRVRAHAALGVDWRARRSHARRCYLTQGMPTC